MAEPKPSLRTYFRSQNAVISENRFAVEQSSFRNGYLPYITLSAARTVIALGSVLHFYEHTDNQP